MAGTVNPLLTWEFDPATVRTVGHDLQRPECILAEKDEAALDRRNALKFAVMADTPRSKNTKG